MLIKRIQRITNILLNVPQSVWNKRYTHLKDKEVLRLNRLIKIHGILTKKLMLQSGQ